MTLPYFLAVLDVIAIPPAVGLGYYAVRMLVLSRRGRLENGWRLVTLGSIMFLVGFISLTVQDFTFAYTMPYYLTDLVATVFSFVGMTLFMLGLRSHYSVWSLKGFIKRKQPAERQITFLNSDKESADPHSTTAPYRGRSYHNNNESLKND